MCTVFEALGGVGLTVALFVANEAFVQPEMQGQALQRGVIQLSTSVNTPRLHKVLVRSSAWKRLNASKIRSKIFKRMTQGKALSHGTRVFGERRTG